MKKRSHARRKHGGWFHGKLQSFQSQRGSQSRRSWTFEKLEDRHLLSASPIEVPDAAFNYVSDETLAGFQELLMREVQWAALQYYGDGEYSLRQLPNDPLLGQQWHLINTGQEVGNGIPQPIFAVPGEDINVAGVWEQGITGEGIVIGIVDSGVQLLHPDLMENIHPTLRLNPISGGTNVDPPAGFGGNPHGTAVAGLAAGDGNNEIGIAGVAFDAQIAPIRLTDGLSPLGFDVAPNDQYIANAISFANQEIQVFNHSWGPSDNERTVSGLGPLAQQALINSIFQGRGGLGNIHVWAAGNGAGSQFSPGFPSNGVWDSASYDGFVNSRYTIGIGGVDHDGSYNNADGTITNYAEAGPAIFAVAPTGSVSLEIGLDTGVGSGIVTTDFAGDAGFNQLPLESGFEIDNDFLEDVDYTSIFNGTSASAPIASGVIALMLQVNPNLSWRDVQEILVRSSRQNAPFEVPGTGSGTTGDLRFVNQSSWIVNTAQLFRDADPFMTGPSVFADVYDPLWKADDFLFFIDPTLPQGLSGFNSRAVFAPPSPFEFTNGAGYTVSHGRGAFGEELGYGHGVVDAEMAVYLASIWHMTGQNLPGERTWTTFVENDNALNVKAGAVGSEESGFIAVPGALNQGTDEFIDFFNEFFVDDPFSGDDPPGNDRGGFINVQVPQSQMMSIETIEVRVSLGGDDNLDFLKMDLVSPNGTHSQLNNYFDLGSLPAPLSLQQDTWPGIILNPPGSINPDGTQQFVWTLSTNRNWGERSDPNLIIDPATGEPFLDSLGDIAHRTWELHMENFSTTAIGADAIEVIFHGSPIGANTQRVQGFVGIDENQDGVFNYDRFLQTTSDSDGDGIVNRQSEMDRIADVTQEAFGAGIILEAVRNSDGFVVDRFVTGHDGNYYFDLVPGDYTIRVADLGNNLGTLIDEANVPEGTLPFYQSEWQITEDWFFAPEKMVETFNAVDGEGNVIVDQFTQIPLEFERFRTVVDESGTPIPFTYTDLLSQQIQQAEDGVRGINFLIDAGIPPTEEVVFNGVVFADLNSDGIINNNDAGVPGVTVFADIDNNGFFDPSSEAFDFTDAEGNYSLAVPLSADTSFKLAAITPSGWSYTSPASGTINVFAGPGDGPFTDLDFGMLPGDGTGDTGIILGTVFNDADANGQMNPGDTGLAGFTVYIDENFNDARDDDEPQVVTNQNGAYAFANLAPGVVRVGVVAPPQWSISTPATEFHQVNVTAGETISDLLFGLVNLASRDFGDLAGLGFPTFEEDFGPSHIALTGFSLGARVDGEVNGQPTANADGDDLNGDFDDEDGVFLVDAAHSRVDGDGNLIFLKPGTNFVEVTVNGLGGLLNAWIDFNNSGTFDGGEQIFDDLDLAPGTHFLSFEAPQFAAGDPRAARYRWGEAGLSYFGPSFFAGEVEDYLHRTTPEPASQDFAPGDYNQDGIVDQSDRNVWISTFGSTSDLRADGNGNGVVDAADNVVWKDNLGMTSAALGSGAGLLLDESTEALPTVSIEGHESSPSPASLLAQAGWELTTIQVGHNRTQRIWVFNGTFEDPVSAATAAITPSKVGQSSPATTSSADSQEAFTRFNLPLDVAVRADRSAPERIVRPTPGNVPARSDFELLDAVLAEVDLSSRFELADDDDGFWLARGEREHGRALFDEALALVVGDDEGGVL